jgi:isopenicillin N synthase-like dioxygenase
MAGEHVIPLIDVEPLFGPSSPARDATDRAIVAAASGSGFMMVAGFPGDIPVGLPMRRELLRLFDAPAALIESLSGNLSDPSRPFVYRGWFAPREDQASSMRAFVSGRI